LNSILKVIFFFKYSSSQPLTSKNAVLIFSTSLMGTIFCLTLHLDFFQREDRHMLLHSHS
jgi:hypothetical protein